MQLGSWFQAVLLELLSQASNTNGLCYKLTCKLRLRPLFYTEFYKVSRLEIKNQISRNRGTIMSVLLLIIQHRLRENI